jgi:hypothetical protein
MKMSFVTYLSDLLSTAAFTAVLLAAVAWLLRSWITERLKNAVKHEYDREIESYKSVLMLVHSASAEGQKAAIEARMRAFDRIWKAMLALKKNTGSITLYLDILTVEEYKTLKNHKDFVAIVGALDEAKIQKMMPDSNIEEARPYVGEVVWSHFYVYQTFNMRIVMLAWWSTSRDEDKINWHRDAPTRGLLAAALTSDELATLDALQIGKIDYVRRTIEMKVLKSWHRIISGAEFGNEALRHAQTILETVSKVGRSG